MTKAAKQIPITLPKPDVEALIAYLNRQLHPDDYPGMGWNLDDAHRAEIVMQAVRETIARQTDGAPIQEPDHRVTVPLIQTRGLIVEAALEISASNAETVDEFVRNFQKLRHIIDVLDDAILDQTRR
jgi:hypothetical protein